MDLVNAGEISTAPESRVDGGDLAARLLDGELRKQLGLSSEQLRVGLAVARNHLARGAYAEAFRIYASLVLCDPMNVDFQVGLANCAGLMGEHHVALQAASAIIALAPADPRGYLLSGRSCLMIGSFAEAQEDLTDAMRHAEITGSDVVTREARHLLDRLSVATER